MNDQQVNGVSQNAHDVLEVDIKEYKGQPISELNEKEKQQLRDWNFDVISVPELFDKFRFIKGMFTDVNVLDVLQIDGQVFASFLSTLREKYDCRSNPFHNFNHGITVAHGIYYIIKQNITAKVLDQTETFTLLFSALCHDVDHTGRGNSFEVNSKSPLFQSYGNQSTLENHHIAMTLRIAQKMDLFRNLSPEKVATIKKFLISNILATDMSKHNDIMNLFKTTMSRFIGKEMSIKDATEQDKLSLSGTLVHAADIGAPARDFSISQKWSLLVSQEFFRQYTLEQELKIPVTPFYAGLDKYIQIAKSESGFIGFFIKPLWIDIANFAEGKLPQVEGNMSRNVTLWQEEYQKELEKQKASIL